MSAGVASPFELGGRMSDSYQNSARRDTTAWGLYANNGGRPQSQTFLRT